MRIIDSFYKIRTRKKPFYPACISTCANQLPTEAIQKHSIMKNDERAEEKTTSNEINFPFLQRDKIEAHINFDTSIKKNQLNELIGIAICTRQTCYGKHCVHSQSFKTITVKITALIIDHFWF